MKFLKSFSIVFLSLIGISNLGCTGQGGGFNLFTVQQDKELGLQVKQQIESDPAQFPILKESENPELYRYIQRITKKILNSGNVQHRNDFAWEVKIIDDPETLNAFCTPGGYIYVYTGLIKFLDSEDQLAGVMGHEIGHAALRHSTRQMTKIYGISTLYTIISGKAEPGQLEQIALGLVNLKFSRTHETEADKASVDYLGGTSYSCSGAAGFFKKLEGQATPPEFLSTHPSPDNRVANIEGLANEQGCVKTESTTEYTRIKNSIR